MDTLVRVCAGDSVGTDTIGKSALALATDALSLKCPRCHCVVDQNPDGCCAMRCGRCGGDFCWLCLASSASSNACHQHVRQCPQSDHQGLVFVPQRSRDKAHKRLRILAVRESLRYSWLLWNPNADQPFSLSALRQSPEVIAVVKDLSVLLKEVDITGNELLGIEENLFNLHQYIPANIDVTNPTFLDLLLLIWSIMLWRLLYSMNPTVGKIFAAICVIASYTKNSLRDVRLLASWGLCFLVLCCSPVTLYVMVSVVGFAGVTHMWTKEVYDRL